MISLGDETLSQRNTDTKTGKRAGIRHGKGKSAARCELGCNRTKEHTPKESRTLSIGRLIDWRAY
jgi:hypothetical protein